MRPKARPTPTSKSVGLVRGFRSGLEDVVAAQIKGRGLKVDYEQEKLSFTQPAKKRTYTPDFRLPNGIIVETKGRFTTEDRQKHLWVKQSHPEYDIRFVFSNSRSRIRKGSPTTYADWCIKNGFVFADKLIPESWFP